MLINLLLSKEHKYLKINLKIKDEKKMKENV